MNAKPTTQDAGQVCCNETWEAAYQRFETPEEEVSKFVNRLTYLGCKNWNKNSKILELCTGRGNGLNALEKLGFHNIEGLDLSASLLSKYSGKARTHVADIRQLPFQDGSYDFVIVQGGLHHLPEFPGDLQKSLGEARRVLRPNGKLVVVEPWRTPFLTFVHAMAYNPVTRRLWKKLDAFYVLTENERDTYYPWLARSKEIIALIEEHFVGEISTQKWGKLYFVGRPKL